MEELLESHGIEWNVFFELDEGSMEHGWSPSIDITEIYVTTCDQDLVDISMDEVLEDCERQLWILKDKGRDL